MTVVNLVKQAVCRPIFWRALVTWGFVIAIFVAGWGYGIALQRGVWEATEPIRYTIDVNNAFNQGERADRVGLFKRYDEVVADSRLRADGGLDYGLDYPPLRLTVATMWYRWIQEHFPLQNGWQNTYEFNAPLLMMNRVFLGIAAAAIFGLVHMGRRWRYAGLLNQRPGAHVGAIPAALAAILVWFSPPALLVGFGWPQWDICVPAFFLAALYAGSRNAWLSAGVLLAIGGMFKGQVFIALPAMLIWPMVAGRWSGLARLLIGLLLGVGVITAPFALAGRYEVVRPEVMWFAASMLVPWGFGLARRFAPRIRGAWWIVPGVVAALVCAMAGGIAAWLGGAVAGACLAALIFVGGQRFRWHYQASLPALGIAGAIWLSSVLTGASWNWLQVGLFYGTDHYSRWQMGSPSNLAALMPSFGVAQPSVIAMTLPEWLAGARGYEMSWKVLLRSVFVVGSVLCGVAMGVHFRRRNPLFLLAATTAWLVFVTFPAQIHERYILYPALASATLLALGCGGMFMHIAISLIAVLPVLQGMLGAGSSMSFLAEEMGPAFGYRLADNVRATHPGMGWALMVITLVCLWKSMDLRRMRGASLPELPALATANADLVEKR